MKLEMYVRGRRLLDLICCGIYNETGGRLHASGTAVRYRDTEATYSVELTARKGRLRKSDYEWFCAFARGVAAGHEASGSLTVVGFNPPLK